MNNVQQFRQYVNRFGYMRKGVMYIEFEGKEYSVNGIWHLIEMGLFGDAKW